MSGQGGRWSLSLLFLLSEITMLVAGKTVAGMVIRTNIKFVSLSELAMSATGKIVEGTEEWVLAA